MYNTILVINQAEKINLLAPIPSFCIKSEIRHMGEMKETMLLSLAVNFHVIRRTRFLKTLEKSRYKF